MPYAVPTLHDKYRELEEQDLISRRPVTYISLPIPSEVGTVYLNWRGYITTEMGLRERARVLDRTTVRPHLLGRPVPGLELVVNI